MFDPYDILAWVIFGSFGMVYVAYGKWKDLWQPKLLGFGLMFLPYFTSSGLGRVSCSQGSARPLRCMV